jgi:putative hydrolase of the HAD superfamily
VDQTARGGVPRGDGRRRGDRPGIVFVGDRPYDDIYGAKRLGMRGVLVPNSEVPPHDGVVPDAVISRLAELTAYLDRW